MWKTKVLLKETAYYLEKYTRGRSRYYALFLRQCNNAMADLQGMKELDMSANLIMSKLIFKIRERFRGVACDIRENLKRKPNFNDVCSVEHQVKCLSDPVLGDIQTTERGIHSRRDVSAVKPNLKRENFATNVYTVNEQYRVTKETKQSNIRLVAMECYQFYQFK